MGSFLPLWTNWHSETWTSLSRKKEKGGRTTGRLADERTPVEDVEVKEKQRGWFTAHHQTFHSKMSIFHLQKYAKVNKRRSIMGSGNIENKNLKRNSPFGRPAFKMSMMSMFRRREKREQQDGFYWIKINQNWYAVHPSFNNKIKLESREWW